MISVQTALAQVWPNGCFTNGLTNWSSVVNAGSSATAGGVNGAGGNGDCVGQVLQVTNGTVYPGQTAPGRAPNSNGLLSMVPPGQTTAVQLFSGHGDNDHNDWARVCQTTTVPTNGNTCLSFLLAGVFENYHYLNTPNDVNGDGYLEVRVLLGAANCANANPGNAVIYDVLLNWEYLIGSGLVTLDGLVGNNAGTYGYDTQTPPGSGTNGCEVNPGNGTNWGIFPWTPYTLNLCQYAGQQITIEVTAYDCNEGGHYIWGYFDCPTWSACAPASVTLTKANNPTGQVDAGQTITYTLNYKNTSNTNYDDGVVVFDTIPTGTGFVSNSQTSNPYMPVTFATGNTVGWDIGYLNPGASGTLSFSVTVNDLHNGSCAETIVNQASEKDFETCYLTPALLTSNAVTNILGYTCTPTFTYTATKTPTPSPTVTPTKTATFTSTLTSTSTTTNTPTLTPTPTPTNSSTQTPTVTSTHTPSDTPTSTRTSTASSTATASFTATATSTTTATHTASSTATNSATSTATATVTNTFVNTATETATQTASSTATLTATSTATSTSTSTATSTNTFTSTSTLTVTRTPTQTYTATATSTATLTATSTATLTATSTPTRTDTATDTSTPTLTATSTATFTATFTPTTTPTFTPTSTLTTTATFTTTNTATATPTVTSTAGISLVKQVSSSLTESGKTLTYTLSVNVIGNTAFGMILTDTLPAQMTYVGPAANNPPSLPAPVSNPSLNQLVWTLPALSPGSYQLSYQAQVNNLVPGGTVLTNSAVLTCPGSQPVTASAQVVVTADYTLKIGVYNEAGELVDVFTTQQISEPIPAITLQTNTITELTGPGGAVTVYFDGAILGIWNGTSGNGTPVSNGTYIIKADNIDSSGNVTTISQQVTVSRPYATVEADIYNEAGELIRHLYTQAANTGGSQITAVNLSSNTISPGTSPSAPFSSVQIFIQTSGSPVTLVWDGTNDSGTKVTDGVYEVQVHWNSGQGEQTDITREITVTGGGHLNTVIAVPNILTPASSTAYFIVQSASSYTLKARIYTVAGELVKMVTGGSGANQVSWDSNGLSSGLYIAVVELITPQGGLSGRQILKISVIH